MTLATMPAQSIAMVSCGRSGCDKPVSPQDSRRGPEKRFCSSKCRSQAWEDEHPRIGTQKALDFATPAPKLNSTAPKERKVALQKACFRILDRLEQGPAMATELLQIGGLRFGARLDELRPFLRSLWGFDPWDKAQNPVLCSKPGSANPCYMLARWAEPASREATRRAAKA